MAAPLERPKRPNQAAPAKPVKVVVPPNHPLAKKRQAQQPVVRRPVTMRPTVVEGKPSGRRIADGGKAPGLGGSNDLEIAMIELDRALRPHPESETEWLDRQLDVQREIRRNDWNHIESRFEYAARELGLDPDAARQWVRKSSPAGAGAPLHVRLGLPHTQGNEGIYGAMMRASGLQARSIAEDSATRFSGEAWNQSPTDFEIVMPDGSRRLIDVQNVYDRGGMNEGRSTMNLGITKMDGGAFGRSWRNASPTDSMQTILKDSYGGIQKPLRSKFTMSDKGFLMPIEMVDSDFVKSEPSMFQQDGIIGGLYNDSDHTPSRILQSERGLSVNGHHGSYNPKLPKRVFGLDLEKMRDTILPMTKAEIEKLQPVRQFDAVRSGTKGSNLALPIQVMEEIGDSKTTLNSLVSDPVKEAVNRMSVARGGRELFAGIPIDRKSAVSTAKELAENWRGGVGLGLVDGASREVGVKLGQGDYAGAAQEAAKTYLTGAAGEKVLRTASSVISKKLPGIGARVAAGTTGSGGLLAPVMATIGVAELADGLVEGFTGKDTIAHVNDGIVRPNYQRTTGDTRTEEQIQANLSGPKRVYGSDKPKQTKPTVTKAAIEKAKTHLTKAAPTVKVEPPHTPTITPTVTPTVKPNNKPGWQKALERTGSWIKGKLGW